MTYEPEDAFMAGIFIGVGLMLLFFIIFPNSNSEKVSAIEKFCHDTGGNLYDVLWQGNGRLQIACEISPKTNQIIKYNVSLVGE